MEDTHGESAFGLFSFMPICLNPYYNGRYSWRFVKAHGPATPMEVLILIIMEDTHGEKQTNWLTEEQSLAS